MILDTERRRAREASSRDPSRKAGSMPAGCNTSVSSGPHERTAGLTDVLTFSAVVNAGWGRKTRIYPGICIEEVDRQDHSEQQQHGRPDRLHRAHPKPKTRKTASPKHERSFCELSCDYQAHLPAGPACPFHAASYTSITTAITLRRIALLPRRFHHRYHENSTGFLEAGTRIEEETNGSAGTSS